MTNIEINKKLHEIALNGSDNYIQRDIALEAIETINPGEHIQKMYGDKGLVYSIDPDHVIHYVDDIVATIENHDGELDIQLDIKNYLTQLAFIAYQITLQNMLLSYGVISREDKLY